MPRLTAKDFPQELLDDYDDYDHGKITKREFLNLAAKYAGGGMTALALFNVLKPNYALATQVEFTDPDIPALIMVFIMTRHRVYDKAAADLAWERTLAWFNKYLR
ncbi:Uncharacterised protein [Citrobacter freundii]|nr:Uncharacterised protein [Citrobacter freundii]